jgi:hypothetical protein
MTPMVPCTIKNLIRFVRCNPNKNVFQIRKQRFIGDICALPFGNQTDVPMISKNVPVLSKILPSKTLDTVSLYSISNFSRNRQPKATAIKIVFTEISDKFPVMKPFPPASQKQKIGSLK